MKPRSFVHVLGIDLGGGKGKKTALATLRVDGEAATVVDIAPRNGALPFYDTALIDTIRQYGDETLLCVDAPLTLPPCLRCTVALCPGQNACVDPSVVEMRALADEAAKASDRDARRGKPPITPYTQRATEVHLTGRLGIVAREGLGQGTGPLAARAAHLLRALADRFRLNENLIEAYPKATLAVLGLGHAVQEDAARARDPGAHSGGAGRRAALRPRRLAGALHPERSPVRGGDLRLHRISLGARQLGAAAGRPAARGRRPPARRLDLDPAPARQRRKVRRRRLEAREGGRALTRPTSSPDDVTSGGGLTNSSVAPTAGPTSSSSPKSRVVVEAADDGEPSSELGPRSRRNSRKASAGGSSAAGISSSSSRAWRRRISPGASLVVVARGSSAGSSGWATCPHGGTFATSIFM